MASSSCRCCRILSIIKDEDGDQKWGSGETYDRHLEVTTIASQVQLRSRNCQEGNIALLQMGNWQNCKDGNGDGGGYWQGLRYIALFGPEKKVGPDLKISSYIRDFSWIQNNMHECFRQHESCLNTDSVSVPGPRVIDCAAGSQTLSTMCAPVSSQYVALSYVWRDAHASVTETPAVIKDAMKVTLELGLRFLWVDKYVGF
jgi:hypothetical protein